MYSIYLITNKINQKKYVGITKFNIEKRWKTHKETAFNKEQKYAIHYAILKYGADNFSISLIEKTDDVNRETYWIDYYNSYNEGYNLTKGGDGTVGFQPNEEQRKVISENVKKLHKEKLVGMHGKRHSEETKRRMSLTARKNHGTDNKPIIIKIKRSNSGVNNPMYGKHHSQETINKISMKHCRKVKIGDITFPSFKEAAKYYNVSSTSIYRMVKKGIAEKLSE